MESQREIELFEEVEKGTKSEKTTRGRCQRRNQTVRGSDTVRIVDGTALCGHSSSVWQCRTTINSLILWAIPHSHDFNCSRSCSRFVTYGLLDFNANQFTNDAMFSSRFVTVLLIVRGEVVIFDLEINNILLFAWISQHFFMNAWMLANIMKLLEIV